MILSHFEVVRFFPLTDSGKYISLMYKTSEVLVYSAV